MGLKLDVIIPTLLARGGATGVQAHVRQVSRYLAVINVNHAVVTPFDILRPLSYPLFALRRVLEVVAPAFAIWLYRCGHGAFLRLALRRHLRSGRPCVIYAQCPVSARSALAAVRTPEQRVVLVVHFNESQADEWVGKGMLTRHSRLYRRILSEDGETLRNVAGIVFVSRFIQDRLRHTVPGITGVPQTIVPNFLEDSEGPSRQLPPYDLVSIGTLEPRKNQSFLLDVLAATRRQGKHYTLAIVGDGPDRATLENRTASLGLESQVSFLGRQSQAAQFFSNAKACVHSAIAETQGIVLIEALANSVPVFAPAVGGVPEVFSDGVEGRYWPLDDAERAAQILCGVLEDTALRVRMSLAARLRFETAFSSAVAGERLASFLASCLLPAG